MSFNILNSSIYNNRIISTPLTNIIILFLYFLSSLIVSTYAQDASHYSNYSNHSNYSNPNLKIQVNEHETSHLIFPSDIIYFDVGDNEHYVADYTNNILRIKGQAANDSRFHKTNLTVITNDDTYYSFYVFFEINPILNYFIKKIDGKPVLNKSKNPQKEISSSTNNKSQIDFKNQHYHQNYNQVHQVAKNRQSDTDSEISDIDIDSNDYEHSSFYAISKTAQRILEKPPLYNQIDIMANKLRAKHGDIELKIKGIHHSLKYCYIYYEVKNHGAIPYDLSYVEFGVREKKRPKRAALNEEKLNILFTLNEDITRVLPYRYNRYVAVLDKLAVSEDRLCYLEIIEDGRNITLKIPYNKLKIGAINE